MVSLCVFCLCFVSVVSLCVFSLRFLSVFSVCVFSLCFLCVCTFSKEVKPVLVHGDLFLGDLLHELHDCISHFHQRAFT